jgi:hypothetical protein
MTRENRGTAASPNPKPVNERRTAAATTPSQISSNCSGSIAARILVSVSITREAKKKQLP